MVESIIINAYGGTARLQVMELATIHVVDHETLTITPFDRTVLGDIERGIAESQMGLGLATDGTLIRVTIPPLSQERREEFVKLIHKKAEGGKIMIRQARQESKDDVEKMKKNNEITEDDEKRLEKEIQKLTDEYTSKIDETTEMKEKELMTV